MRVVSGEQSEAVTAESAPQLAVWQSCTYSSRPVCRRTETTRWSGVSPRRSPAASCIRSRVAGPVLGRCSLVAAQDEDGWVHGGGRRVEERGRERAKARSAVPSATPAPTLAKA